MQHRFEYTIRKSKRAKRLRLTVYCDGNVVVTTPAWVRQSTVHDFIAEKREWIDDKLQLFRGVKQLPLPSTQKAYQQYKEEALLLVTQRVEYFLHFYPYTYRSINIKNQKTRWGSCSIQKNLNFNYKILFLPPAVRDYVIVHEICHLAELNHSPAFWAFVKRTIPNHKELRAQLKGFDLRTA